MTTAHPGGVKILEGALSIHQPPAQKTTNDSFGTPGFRVVTVF